MVNFSAHASNRMSQDRPVSHDAVYRAAYSATDLLMDAHRLAVDCGDTEAADMLYRRYATLDMLTADYSIKIDDQVVKDGDSVQLLHNMSRLTDLYHDVGDLTEVYDRLERNSVDIHIDRP